MAALVFTIIAICTFMLKGKQWPTMLTTALAVWYLAGRTYRDAPDSLALLWTSFIGLF